MMLSVSGCEHVWQLTYQLSEHFMFLIKCQKKLLFFFQSVEKALKQAHS